MTWCLVSALAVNAEEAALGKLGQEKVSWRRGACPVEVVAFDAGRRAVDAANGPAGAVDVYTPATVPV